MENLQASYNDDNDGGDDHGKSDKGPDTENVTEMANKIFETQLADSGKKNIIERSICFVQGLWEYLFPVRFTMYFTYRVVF